MVAPVEVSHSLVLALCRWHDCGKRKVPSKKNSAKAATLCCCNISKHWISQEKKIKLVIFSPSAVEKSWHILPQPASRKGQWTPVVLWTTGLPGLHASPPEKGHHGSAWDVLFTNGVFYQKYDYETTKQHKQPLSGFSQDVLFFIYFSWRFPGLCHPWIFRRHLFGVRRRHAVGHVIRVVHLTAKHSTEEPGISMDIWDQLRSTGINWRWFWANYNNSLTWIKAIWGWFPLLTMISSEVAVRSL